MNEWRTGYPTERENRRLTLREYQKLRVASELVHYDCGFEATILYLNNQECEVPENLNSLTDCEKQRFYERLAQKILEVQDDDNRK